MGRSEVETLPWLGFVRRIIRKAGERVADADEFELAELVALRDDLEAAIAVAVAGQQSRTSWARIGDALGITRQAAQQRYGKRASA